MHVPRHDPQPRAAAEPVQRSERESHDQPAAAQVGEGGEKPFEILAEEHEDDDDAEKGDDGEQLEAAPQQPRGEGEGHVGAKVQVSGVRGQVSGGSYNLAGTRPLTRRHQTPDTRHLLV